MQMFHVPSDFHAVLAPFHPSPCWVAAWWTSKVQTSSSGDIDQTRSAGTSWPVSAWRPARMHPPRRRGRSNPVTFCWKSFGGRAEGSSPITSRCRFKAACDMETNLKKNMDRMRLQAPTLQTSRSLQCGHGQVTVAPRRLPGSCCRRADQPGVPFGLSLPKALGRPKCRGPSLAWKFPSGTWNHMGNLRMDRSDRS